MSAPSFTRRAALAVLAALTLGPSLSAAAATTAPAAQGLPADSIYQLPLTLTDQSGHDFALASRLGHPVLVSMFYTSCEFVCPMLVEALRATEAGLSADEREQLTVLMVSFDPARDTVAVLQRTAGERSLDLKRWTLARSDAKSVRKLAAVLGIQYRQLANGDFNHSTAIVLVDANGRIAGRTAKLGDADPVFVKQVKATVHRP